MNKKPTEEKLLYEDMEKYATPDRKVNLFQSDDNGENVTRSTCTHQDLKHPSISGQKKTSLFNSEIMRQRTRSAPVVKPKPRVSGVAGNGPIRSTQKQERDNQTRCNSFSVAPQFRRSGLLDTSDHDVKNKQPLVSTKDRRRTRNASIESEYIYPTCDFYV